MASNSITVEILNWDKFCPRKNLKATSWLRLSNKLLEDPDFFEFSHSELMAWIYILSLASQKQSSTVRVNFSHADRICRLKQKDLESALEKLTQLQCVRVDDTRTTHACDTDDTHTAHHVTERNERNVTERDETKRNGCDDSASLPSPTGKTLGSRIFEAYAEEYRRRWGKDPVRNAKVNRNCADLGKRLGEEALDVARFYVRHNKAFYVQSCHPLGLLLQDAEGLHTQWVTGRQVTSTEARSAENRQQLANAFGAFLVPEGGAA